MEMDSNPITKPSKKGTILSVAFYVLAVVLLITAFVSLAACHQNISRQLEQGVPVQGNELAIVNLYLTSCVQYFAFAAAMVFCGKAARSAGDSERSAGTGYSLYAQSPDRGPRLHLYGRGGAGRGR